MLSLLISWILHGIIIRPQFFAVSCITKIIACVLFYKISFMIPGLSIRPVIHKASHLALIWQKMFVMIDLEKYITSWGICDLNMKSCTSHCKWHCSGMIKWYICIHLYVYILYMILSIATLYNHAWHYILSMITHLYEALTVPFPW